MGLMGCTGYQWWKCDRWVVPAISDENGTDGLYRLSVMKWDWWVVPAISDENGTDGLYRLSVMKWDWWVVPAITNENGTEGLYRNVGKLSINHWTQRNAPEQWSPPSTTHPHPPTHNITVTPPRHTGNFNSTDSFDTNWNYIRKVPKLRKATLSVFLSVCPSATRLPPDGFSLNLVFEYVSKICRFVKIWQ